MYDRHLTTNVAAALADTPVLLITGARQVGKTTLARSVAEDATYVNLDDVTPRAAATGDPDGFVAGLARPVIIDEIQRVPELLLAIKAAVDRQRIPGGFLLTGSSNVFAMPAAADALTGRIEIHRLRPLSQVELEGVAPTFLAAVFDGNLSSVPGEDRARVIDRILRGGFPEATGRVGARRIAWLRSWLDTMVQRDLRDVAALGRVDEMPRILSLLAAAAPGTPNLSSLSTATGIPRSSIDRYVGALRQLFVIEQTRPWFANIGTRQIKSPRTLIGDSGLMSLLLGEDASSVGDWASTKLGALLENFVGLELVTQASWEPDPPTVHYWRTVKQHEVDFVLERRDGSIVGIEVKASASITSDAFRHLRRLREAAGPRWRCGVVLHLGTATTAFDADLFAAPVSSLWSSATPG